MENNNNLYEITVYSENQVGLLSTIAGIFTRRSLNIESLRVFPSEIKGIHKFSIKTRAAEEQVIQVVKQVEKKVDVIKAFYYVEEERHDKELNAVEALINERMNKQNK